MWNGEKFVVKPFQLTKISLAAFRGAIISTTVIANIQIKVARTTSEVKTPINVPEKSATEGEMPGQQEFAQQISLLDAFARNEISRISETLRNMKANLSGCEALVQQTFAVLSATDLRNDGQLANFSVTIQDQLSGISGNLSRSDMARQKFADLAENISRSESTANTNLANLTEMVLGMARNFSQFELRYQTKFNDVTGSLSLGNQKMATLSDSLSGLTLNLTKSDSLTRQRLTDMSDTISRSETSWKGKMASLGHPVGSDGKCYTSH
ncbi:hypothetical protein BV898_14106 [Hypsibius exemplaris]|uniref:Uncharacterized protein n=1 Tax=Hypsibius exemplaris TaxID=2072580 RepID=A0A1W0W8W5_HYPEX|nr:hypothetical protein BV898_14106 [Hypsibius exemplaris]